MQATYSAKEVAGIRGVSEVHIGRMWRSGQMPQPAKIPGTRGFRWNKSEIDAWAAAGFVHRPGFDGWEHDLSAIRQTAELLKMLLKRKLQPELQELARVAVEFLADSRVPVQVRKQIEQRVYGGFPWVTKAPLSKEQQTLAAEWTGKLRDMLANLKDGPMTPIEIAEAWSHLKAAILAGESIPKELIEAMDAGAAELLRPPTSAELADLAAFGAFVGNEAVRKLGEINKQSN